MTDTKGDGTLRELPQGGGEFLPRGWPGVLAAMPFAVWLFLAIEELPLAAEESVDPRQDMPKGLIFGLFTLIFSALMILFLNASLRSPEAGKLHGSYSRAASSEPLLDGFRVIYGGQIAELLSLFAVIGLTVILAVWFSFGAAKGGSVIGATLLNMAVFGAMISYALQVALVTLYFQLQDPVYREGVYAALGWYLAGILYFAFVGRHKLVLSPEEQFALSGGRYAHCQREGYGTTTKV